MVTEWLTISEKVFCCPFGICIISILVPIDCQYIYDFLAAFMALHIPGSLLYCMHVLSFSGKARLN